jgi:hypothetical protein
MKTKEYNLAAAVKELDDTVLDANDAFYEFDEQLGNIFSDSERAIFCEGFNQGADAMRAKAITMLGGK